MATKIVVPQLGESVVEATISRWLKKEGDSVSPGDVLVELETDKVNLEVGAEQGGVLSHIEKQEGQDVKVGEQIGVIDEGAVVQKVAETKAPAAQKPPAAPPAPPAEPPASKKAAAGPADKVKATPSARRLAQDNNLDLAQIPGSGPGTRIDVADVQRYLDNRKPAATASQEPSSVPTPAPALELVRKGAREERERMSRRRRTIAQRMVEAQRTAAILTTYNEVDMTQIMELRARRKESFKKQYGIGLGIVSFFVKASIRALKDFPKMNAEIQGDEILYKYYYDIGVAIGATEGLVVPVLRDADRLSFAEIEKAIKEFAEKGEKGTLTLDDLRGGTFTITNGGVFGSLLSSPILNPPQVGILGLHKIEERPIAINKEVVIRPMMYIALSYDHRLIDGRESVQFLARLKELIEDPATLLVES